MKTPKTTILDYLDWRGDLSFEADKFNEIDGLIFSTLAYIDFTAVTFVNTFDPQLAPTLSEAYKILCDNKHGDEQLMELLKKCSECERFKDVVVYGYDSVIDEELLTQFCAMSFYLGNSEGVITFRGTDDTLVGWEEDLNMSFSKIPAQEYAQKYADFVATSCSNISFYIVGHSKGGNLAIWAGAHLSDDNFKRLIRIFDFDGPGFCGDFTQSQGYRRIKDRTVKYVVDSSIVGMFLDSDTDQKIVAGNVISSVMQHYPMSWVVVGNKFYTLEDRSSKARTTEVIVKEWIDTLTFDERKQVTEILFEILRSSNAKTLSQLRGPEGIRNVIPILKKYSDTEKEKKQFLISIIARLKPILKKRATSVFDNLWD